jgi:lysophospholipase L1-like esterase
MKIRILWSALLIILLFPSILTQAQIQQPKQKTLVILGSSVASGWVTSYQEKFDMQDGYAARLSRTLEPEGWVVINKSVPGMDTKGTIQRFTKEIVPVDPDIVFIGLSMSNEGLETLNPDTVFLSYKNGIRALIDSCKKHEIIPVIGLCYANNNYTEEQYQYLKKMNILIQSWGLPTVNLLGALNDGSGHFPEAYIFDPNHPNDLGHEALYRAFVPDLFDVVLGNKKMSGNGPSSGSIMLGNDMNHQTISYIPSEPMLSFTFGFSFQTKGNGTIASIFSADKEMIIGIDPKGKMIYQGNQQKCIFGHTLNLGSWHDLVICHGYLEKQTTLYLDGKKVGSIDEEFDPLAFLLKGNKQGTSFRDLRIYRATLTPEEIESLYEHKPVDGSLELLAPLDDGNLSTGMDLSNNALSNLKAVLDDPNQQQRVDSLIMKTEKALDVRNHELIVEPKQPIAIDPAIYEQYQGIYEIAPGDCFSVILEDEHLFFEDRGNRAEIFPESETKFFIRYPAELTVTFVVDPDGTVTGLIFAMNGREMRAKRTDQTNN